MFLSQDPKIHHFGISSHSEIPNPKLRGSPKQIFQNLQLWNLSTALHSLG